MKKSTDISLNFKPLGQFFQRFHLTIFIVVIVGGLSYAVVSIYNVLSDASTTPAATSSSTTSSSLSQSTIDRLTQMSPSDSAPAPASLPAGRINPFGE